MDDAMIGKLLQTYGAQPTVKNANLARQFYASNPQVAEHRAMGMRGSVNDDNSDIFGAQLDKFIADSSPAPQQAPQSEQAPMPTVQAASQPTKKTATAAYPNPNEAAGTPNNVSGPQPSLRETVRGGGGFGVDDIVTALLGLSSAAGVAKMAPNAKAQPRAIGNDGQALPNPFPQGQKQLTYEPKLTDEGANLSRVKTNEPAATQVQGDPGLTEQARKAQLEAEVLAENADAEKLTKQIQERNTKQNATRDLLKSAKRTVTGR